MTQNFSIIDIDKSFSISNMPFTPIDVELIKAKGFQTVISIIPPSQSIVDLLKEKKIRWVFPKYNPSAFGVDFDLAKSVLGFVKGKTLLHCIHGVTASCLVSAYLASKGYSFEDAMNLLKGKRFFSHFENEEEAHLLRSLFNMFKAKKPKTLRGFRLRRLGTKKKTGSRINRNSRRPRRGKR